MNAVARSHVERVFSAVGTQDSPLRSMSNFPGESWHRCLHDYKLTPEHPPEIPVLSHSESRLAREAMGEALVLAVEEMDALYKLVSAVGYTVMIADHHCMTVAEPLDTANSRETRLLGSIWTERETGTNGVGTCLHDVRPTSVYLQEHFFGQHVDFSCACFPLVDYRNQAWGALDLAIHNPHLGPDVHRFVMQVGQEAAERIDEAVFRATFRYCMIAKLRNKEGRRGLLAIREGQRIIAASQAMREMLGLETSDFGAVELETLFAGGADLFRRAMNTGRIQVHGIRGEVFLGSVTPSTEMRAMPNSVSPTRSLVPNRATRSVAGDTISLDDWAGAEMSMIRSLEVIRKTLPFDLPILILGETGTGKDTLARAIHRESERRDKPFVALNCGAIPEGLIEAELFGYVDGAFTGARRDGSRGHLLRADGGTLFLDEIGEMPGSPALSVLLGLYPAAGSGRDLDSCPWCFARALTLAVLRSQCVPGGPRAADFRSGHHRGNTSPGSGRLSELRCCVAPDSQRLPARAS
jgi:sigma-54 dependent transcriptional regulator, acetoin dehydrogenase operon transcriptional activator AcoR